MNEHPYVPISTLGPVGSTQRAINSLIEELDGIAQRNNDRFAYRIEFPKGRVVFVAEENSDNHTFVSGTGTNIEMAVADATRNILVALKHWRYK